jgi:hypothetical protein
MKTRDREAVEGFYFKIIVHVTIYRKVKLFKTYLGFGQFNPLKFIGRVVYD